MTLSVLRSVSIALAAIILVGATVRPPWEREQVRAGNGIHAMLELEDRAYQNGDQAALGQLIDGQAAGRWQSIWKSVRSTIETEEESGGPDSSVELLELERTAGLIMAEVIVHRPAYGWTGFNPYRETRFYRETHNGWLRTVPAPDFWGAPTVLESDFLRFEFHARDLPYVQDGLPHWDRLYRSLHEMMGLQISEADTKVTFVIKPEPVRGRGGYGDRFEGTSPLLVQRPDYLSPADYLTQSVVSRLTYYITSVDLLESSNGQRYEEAIIGRWRMVRRGLRSWLRSELLEPDWPWDQQAQAVFEASLSDRKPLKLSDLALGESNTFTERDTLFWQTASAASIFAYATDVYGDAILPDLITGFKEHRTWEELIATVFDATVEEFEAGWNRWLDDRRNS